MTKRVTEYIKLQIPAGKATSALPIGSALDQHGVNTVQFTRGLNARTADQGDMIIPIVTAVYANRGLSSITKAPPAAVLIKRVCSVKTTSVVPNKNKVAALKEADLWKIVETRVLNSNAVSLEAATSTIVGTAGSMGVTTEE